MFKVVGLACMSMLVVCLVGPQSSNSSSNSSRFAGYKAVEAYEIRPGILMMPRYADNGEVCEIGLEGQHYSAEMIRLDSGLSRTEIDKILDELVPVNERGAKKTAPGRTDEISEIGHGLVASSEYENISVQIYSAISSSKKRKIVAENIAATIRWTNRRCPQVATTK